MPDYVGYLAHIIANMRQETEHIRTIAGYLLKSHSGLLIKAPPEVAAYAKAAILQAFRDPQPMIRKVTGQVIVAFLNVLEPRNWTEALTLLVHSLDSPDSEEQEVSVRLVLKGYIVLIRLERFRCLRKGLSRLSTEIRY